MVSTNLKKTIENEFTIAMHDVDREWDFNYYIDFKDNQ